MVIHRNTKQRQVILEELGKLPGHPCVSEIYAAVRKRLPSISLGTVYRNLEFLTQSGMIRKLDQGSGQAQFDRSPDRHLHLRCIHCDQLIDLPVVEFGLLKQSENLQLEDHLILGIRAEYVGICPDCQQSLTPAERARLILKWSSDKTSSKLPATNEGC